MTCSLVLKVTGQVTAVEESLDRAAVHLVVTHWLHNGRLWLVQCAKGAAVQRMQQSNQSACC